MFFNKDKNKDKQEKKGFFTKLKTGLEKSSNQIGGGIKDIFNKKKLDDQTIEEFEDLLIASDLGVKTTAEISKVLTTEKYDKEITADEIKQVVADEVVKVLAPVVSELKIDDGKRPYIILFCGVNGTGKTTTIGKLASKYCNEGKKVMVAACDTYRAAAIGQLEVWAERSGAELIKGAENSDPASVAYEACEKAKQNNIDILLIDTAGRLQNKTNLMEQLIKINRVIKKHDESAPHDNIIVLDATTGQNANSQVKTFKEMVDVNAMIVNKLDGTAKGGVVVSLAKEFALPIYAIGVGEQIDDLQSFEAEAFAKGLVDL